MNMNRRTFLGGALMSGVWAGLPVRGVSVEMPELRFGVVSDIHVTTPESAALFEASLRYFRSRDVDAMMVPGDVTDWGTKQSLQYVADAWNRVFPREPAGGGKTVTPLFCTGNHDFEGWLYPDMTMEMHANGYSEDEALVRLGLKACWEEVFHEPWAPLRIRTVKGYDFVSCEWKGQEGLGDFMKEHATRLSGQRPFFFFQHSPIKGTTSDEVACEDGGVSFEALKAFPNAVCFTGHAHHTFNDERSIWQGAFTAVATPSLSYADVPEGHENGNGRRDGGDQTTMPPIAARREFRGGQGYVVNVYRDRIVIERLDFEEGGVEGAPPWTFPLPVSSGSQPYAPAPRAKAAPVPTFLAGARLETYTCNTETRQGRWAIAMTLKFPTALAPKGQRVYDYELRVEPKDGGAPLVKRFLSPAFHKLAKYEPKMQTFWFNVDELPQDKPYVMKVYPRNWYGTCGEPLVSKVWHGKPGLDKVK